MSDLGKPPLSRCECNPLQDHWCAIPGLHAQLAQEQVDRTVLYDRLAEAQRTIQVLERPCPPEHRDPPLGFHDWHDKAMTHEQQLSSLRVSLDEAQREVEIFAHLRDGMQTEIHKLKREIIRLKELLNGKS